MKNSLEIDTAPLFAGARPKQAITPSNNFLPNKSMQKYKAGSHRMHKSRGREKCKRSLTSNSDAKYDAKRKVVEGNDQSHRAFRVADIENKKENEAKEVKASHKPVNLEIHYRNEAERTNSFQSAGKTINSMRETITENGQDKMLEGNYTFASISNGVMIDTNLQDGQAENKSENVNATDAITSIKVEQTVASPTLKQVNGVATEVVDDNNIDNENAMDFHNCSSNETSQDHSLSECKHANLLMNWDQINGFGKTENNNNNDGEQDRKHGSMNVPNVNHSNSEWQVNNRPENMALVRAMAGQMCLPENYHPKQLTYRPTLTCYTVNHINNYSQGPAQISQVEQLESKNLPPDEYEGTRMSEKSLRKLVMKSILCNDDVRDLGLELDFTSAMIQQYVNQNNPPTAAFQLILEWRNSRCTGSREEKYKILHDAFVEIGKISQAVDICSQPQTCQYHN